MIRTVARFKSDEAAAAFIAASPSIPGRLRFGSVTGTGERRVVVDAETHVDLFECLRVLGLAARVPAPQPPCKPCNG